MLTLTLSLSRGEGGGSQAFNNSLAVRLHLYWCYDCSRDRLHPVPRDKEIA